MHFCINYDPGQESNWHWLTKEHIHDFYALCFTKDQPPHPCMVRHEGHRPKMLLWMLKECIHILGHLQDED